MEFLCGYILLFSVMTDFVAGLQCWHCIGEDCNMDPTDNERAKETRCYSNDQTCQKVYFEMFDNVANVVYTSTVRGCANYCETRNDFDNCSYVQRTTLGCVRKDCCHDKDFCNGSNELKLSVILLSALLYISSTWTCVRSIS